MRILLLSFILVFQLQNGFAATDSQTLRMLWWNVKAFNNDNGQILQTLEDVSENYDLILLGESRASVAEKLKQAAPEFRYSNHVNYPGDLSISISVLSKFPIKLIKTEKLGWGANEQKTAWIQKYKKVPYNPDRNISFYEVIKNNQKYVVAPIHFMNPWHIIREIDGLISTSYNIYFGISNPLFYQTQMALEKISELGFLDTDLPFVLIGDFNSPSNPTTGSTLKLLSEDLTNLMSDERPTFMSQGLKIDHAFGNSKVNSLYDEVLFFEGSDHYPIEVEVAP